MKIKRPKHIVYLMFAGLVGLTAMFGLTGKLLWAQEAPEETTRPPLHPDFALLDADGENVVDTGEPVSTMNTCGSCHDTAFIAEHSFHADVGLSEFGRSSEEELGHTWDASPGYFGRWDPLTYRYLSPAGDEQTDLTTPEWLMTLGARHVGGGPAVFSRDGEMLTDLPASAGDPETSIWNEESGEFEAWDWQESGVVEMNCFLCHLPDPNNEARIDTLQAGEFGWANTATLLGSGLVERDGSDWLWNQEAFDAEGKLKQEFIMLQDPAATNCAQCHGLVHSATDTPLVIGSRYGNAEWSTRTTGQIVAGQRLSDSGLNLTGKADLSRSFDVHAERVLDCTNCHYALNNPVYYEESADSRPDHLTFDPRRLDINAYLYRPLHQFAKGSSAQSDLAPELDNTLRRCSSCHDAANNHTWLPYAEGHIEAVACETCHIPKMYAAAQESVDWTTLLADGTPLTSYRGVEGDPAAVDSLVTGFEPVLIQQKNPDGGLSLAPHNMITAFYWVYGSPERPVPLRELEAAYFGDSGEGYDPAIISQFDANGDGLLSEEELRLDTSAKEGLIAGRLAAAGLDNPRIAGEVRPYSINHSVTNGEWATRECRSCHSTDSLITQPLQLASFQPGGVTPVLLNNADTALNGDLIVNEAGALIYQPSTSAANLYVFGHDSTSWIDLVGIVLFLGTIAGVIGHGGLRYFAARRQTPHEPRLRAVYMYTVYERFWHWLQTAAILILLLTGLIIHKPDTFGMLSFRYVVLVHNVLALLLLINATLSLFYHLVSGEIKQYLPQPRGFFSQAIEQSLFYVRGIFNNEAHPFEKTPERKLNPLQQMTYFAILNLLLPLQFITGILMWGVQRWPDIAASLGGLPFLAPFHSLIAWLFGTFIVLHVYLTTTGHKPMAGIKAMMVGWDEVELPRPSSTD